MNIGVHSRSFAADMPAECEHSSVARRHVTTKPASRGFRLSALLIVLLVCVAGLLAALAWPMLRGEVYVADDLGEFHLPLRNFYSQQLTRGEPFDWCPDLYCGLYLTGEGQLGGYHPLHWLLYRTLPLSLAFDLECWLSYPLMLAGMFVLLARWRLRREAALLGAMAFTFGGFNLLHFVHPNAISIVAHMPWLLYAIDVAMRSSNARHRCWAWAAVSLLCASQLLLGYPQYVLFSAVIELGYVLLLSFSMAPYGGTYRGPACLVGATLLGALIAAVQLLPTFDLLQHSVRKGSESLATQGSLHPLNVLQLVAPYLFTNRVIGQNTHELGLYVGAVPLALAAWQISNRANRKRFKFLTIAAIACAVFGLLWSFGEFGPVAWLERHLPLANKFRLPCRAIVIFQFGMAILAALGFANLLGPRIAFKVNWIRNRNSLWLLAIAAVLIPIGATTIWPEHVSKWPLVAIGPVLVLVAVGLLHWATIGARWALPAIAALAAVDLAAYGLTASVYNHVAPLADFVEQTGVPPGGPNRRLTADLACGLESAPGQNGTRVGDRMLLAGWKRADGYAGLEPARQLDYRQLPALRLAGVGWISDRAARQCSIAPSDSIDSSDHWMRIANPSSRALLVTEAIQSRNPAVDVAKLTQNQAIVEEPLPLTNAPRGIATIAADRPGRIAIETSCPGDQLLVVNESFYPGWVASIDGKSAKLLRVNGDFMGVIAPTGRHEICLEFRPQSLQTGRLLSCFGLGLLVITLLLGTLLSRAVAR